MKLTSCLCCDLWQCFRESLEFFLLFCGFISTLHISCSDKAPNLNVLARVYMNWQNLQSILLSTFTLNLYNFTTFEEKQNNAKTVESSNDSRFSKTLRSSSLSIRWLIEANRKKTWLDEQTCLELTALSFHWLHDRLLASNRHRQRFTLRLIHRPPSNDHIIYRKHHVHGHKLFPRHHDLNNSLHRSSNMAIPKLHIPVAIFVCCYLDRGMTEKRRPLDEFCNAGIQAILSRKNKRVDCQCEHIDTFERACGFVEMITNFQLSRCGNSRVVTRMNHLA